MGLAFGQPHLYIHAFDNQAMKTPPFLQQLIRLFQPHTTDKTDTSLKFLIVGLGNVGSEYSNTRHNIGFWVLDALAKALDTEFTIERHAYVARAKFKGRSLVLIKPTTYMNLSGKAYKYWLDKEKIPVEQSLVIVDEKDLDLGVLRVRAKGSGGSHNGMNHIISTLGNTQFPRLRVGIGNNFSRGKQIDFVLGEWNREEEAALLPRIDLAIDIIKAFTTIGLSRTMNEYNNK